MVKPTSFMPGNSAITANAHQPLGSGSQTAVTNTTTTITSDNDINKGTGEANGDSTAGCQETLLTSAPPGVKPSFWENDASFFRQHCRRFLQSSVPKVRSFDSSGHVVDSSFKTHPSQPALLQPRSSGYYVARSYTCPRASL